MLCVFYGPVPVVGKMGRKCVLVILFSGLRVVEGAHEGIFPQHSAFRQRSPIDYPQRGLRIRC